MGCRVQSVCCSSFDPFQRTTHASSTGQCILQAFKCLKLYVAKTFRFIISILDDLDIFDGRRREVFRDSALVDIERQVAYESYVRGLVWKGEFLSRRVGIFWSLR